MLTKPFCVSLTLLGVDTRVLCLYRAYDCIHQIRWDILVWLQWPHFFMFWRWGLAQLSLQVEVGDVWRFVDDDGVGEDVGLTAEAIAWQYEVVVVDIGAIDFNVVLCDAR